MKRAALIVVLTIISIFVYNCRYDNEEELYAETDPEEICDTLNVRYSLSIQPILSANCYSCHSNTTSGAFGSGINLESHSGLVEVAHSGRLTGAITHSPGFSAMPQGGTKLDDCSINKIKAWIKEGALNN